MTTRMPTSAIRRPSLPLTERDEQDLVLLRESEVRRRILASLSGDTAFSADASEAVMLHAVFKVTLKWQRSKPPRPWKCVPRRVVVVLHGLTSRDAPLAACTRPGVRGQVE
jgi:hypothetical protein